MNYLLRAAIALLFLTIAAPSQAQPSALEFAPLQLAASGWYAPTARQGSATLTARRTIPLFFFLPHVSEDSRIDLFAVTAGVRPTNGDVSLAWSIRPLEIFLAKSPWAGGMTLLSYDRSGPFRLNANWIGLRAGPAFRTGGDEQHLEGRLLGSASLTTFAMTGGVFPGEGEGATGLDGSLTAQLLAKLGRRLTLEAEASAARLFAGRNPERHAWSIGARVGTGSITVLTSLGQLRAESSSVRAATEWLAGISVRIVPRAQAF